MGREWNWSGRSKRGGYYREEEAEAANSSGCLAAVFQFFDYHPTRYTLNHHHHPSFSDDLSPLPSGVEAPRNSLDLEELPLPCISKENLHIPIGVKIKTRGSNGSNNGYFPDNLNTDSPTAKTPNLVARLMGLDLLPEAGSSSPSSHSYPATSSNRLSRPHPTCPSHSYKHQGNLHCRPRISSDADNITSCRSLPETPRISLARKSNVDCHHRLSLQDEDRQSELLSGFKRRDVTMMNDENRSPNQSAKQILRRVKENVSRKAGFEITNTIKSSNSIEKPGSKRNSEEDFRLMEINNRKEQASKVAVKQKPKVEESHKSNNCKLFKQKVNEDKRVRPRSKKAQLEEPCVRSSKAAKAINKTCPSSSHLLSFNNVVPSIILPTRTNPPSSTTKRPEKQIPNFQESKRESQLSCSSSKTYRQKTAEGNDKKHIEIGSRPKTSTYNNNGRPELEYVSRILSRTSFSKDAKGHVENPSAISGQDHGEQLCYSDRKLLSDLVDELLGEILRNGETFSENEGSEVTYAVWRKIICFPKAKCEVLDDIDRLIEGDLKKSKLERGFKMAMEEGGEGLVREIEKDIMEKLVHDATAMAFRNGNVRGQEAEWSHG